MGRMFPEKYQLGRQERLVVQTVIDSYDKVYPDQKQLVVSLTWFDFENTVEKLIKQNKMFDRVIWCCVIDPLPTSIERLNDISLQLGAKDIVFYGSGFDIGVNAIAIALLDEFESYTTDQLVLKTINDVYICYNRKPKPHRIKLVEGLIANDLTRYGTITLGADDVDYDVTEGMETDIVMTIKDDTPDQYTQDGKFKIMNNFGGVPYDLLSLGKLDIWQGHFLNVVSETICQPWEPTFVTEKTFKPIIGLRPFVINGQPDTYSWLRKRGFKTFEKYYYGIELEDLHEDLIVPNVIQLVKKFCSKNSNELLEIYADMLPDLCYNRERVFEFAREQKNEIEALCKQI